LPAAQALDELLPAFRMTESPPLRALYICYLSLEDPLVETQVVAYLQGLARRGHTIHLLTFDARLEPGARRSIDARLARRGIAWHSLRYHKRPSLPATVFDVLAGGLVATRIVRRHRLEAIHARNHVPGAMALIARMLTRCRLIFDLRGLMADEYADAGRWKMGGLPYRLTEAVQRAALRRAEGVVTLTDAVRPHLSPARAGRDTTSVIPCCADLELIEGCQDRRETIRAEIGARDRPVMVYVGKFTGWYMEREMAEFFAVARRSWPDLLFLVITQADPAPMLHELARQGIQPDDYHVLSSAPEDIGCYLAAADFGISLIRPCFSKISSSPTKIGEYLGAGLPVLSSAGIGDVDSLLESGPVGVLIEDFTERGYEAAAGALRQLCGEAGIRERCRGAAREKLSLRDVGVPRYDELYRRVALHATPG
jgi:glycosyltransferase involved in cell wall biosynthesis